MISFIPMEYYATTYYNIMLFFVLVVFAQSMQLSLESPGNLRTKKLLGGFIVIVVLIYIGLRPISIAFGDMAVYAQQYYKYQEGEFVAPQKDFLFEMLMRFFASFATAEMFFLVCSLFYILPLYAFSKKIFCEYWFYAFFIMVLSFSFFAYGTNGIRNGIATSLFLYALTKQNKIYIGLWMFIAVSIHQSMIVPAFAFVISLFYKDVKTLVFGWILAIPLSLILGTFWENFFMSLGLVDEDRVVGYLSGSDVYLDNLVELKTGFRWDFLIYSAFGIFAGVYFILKKKFDDVLYRHIFSVYVISNALWVLVIRANFSNRIAYLSWFLLGVVIIYPLLKSKMFATQHKIIGGILIFYFMFTYLLNVVLTSSSSSGN